MKDYGLGQTDFEPYPSVHSPFLLLSFLYAPTHWLCIYPPTHTPSLFLCFLPLIYPLIYTLMHLSIIFLSPISLFIHPFIHLHGHKQPGRNIQKDCNSQRPKAWGQWKLDVPRNKSCKGIWNTLKTRGQEKGAWCGIKGMGRSQTVCQWQMARAVVKINVPLTD